MTSGLEGGQWECDCAGLRFGGTYGWGAVGRDGHIFFPTLLVYVLFDF